MGTFLWASVILPALWGYWRYAVCPKNGKRQGALPGYHHWFAVHAWKAPYDGQFRRFEEENTLMIGLTAILKDLRTERETFQAQLTQLDGAVTVLQSLTHPNSRHSRRAATTRHPFSLATRRRMAAAQKARWAKWTSEHARPASGKNVDTTRRVAKPVQSATVRPRLSAAARKRIAAAQRARWASWRAKQPKKK
jgi:hypothetical protein